VRFVQVCVLGSRVVVTFTGEKRIEGIERVLKCLKECGIELEIEYEGVCG